MIPARRGAGRRGMWYNGKKVPERKRSTVYKLLIVDDEAIVREGIEHNIEWSDLGFEFVGAYENGTDGAAAVAKLRPAVVITDICMPFGDGLDLTERITAKYPGTKVILLSGYDEFAYAQRAVKLGAYDYILKPITAAELRSLLERVRADLDEEAARTEALRAAGRSLSEVRAARIRRLTEKLLQGEPTGGTSSDRQVAGELGGAGVLLPLRAGAIFVCTVDPAGEKRAALQAVLSRLADTLPGCTFVDHEERVVAIVSAQSEDEALGSATEIAAGLVAGGPARLGGTTTVGLGTSFSTLDGLGRSYRSAVYALDYRFIAGPGRVIDHFPRWSACSGFVAGRDEPSPEFRSAVSLLLRSLRACDLHESQRAVKRLAEEMRRSFVSQTRCRLQIHSILVRINDLRETLEVEAIPDGELSNLPTLDGVIGRLVEICAAVIETQVKRRRTYADNKAQQAIAYIDEHYAVSSLSLTGLCTALGVSSSHFSSIFKTYTGRTFVEHLTEVRVDRAKHLLKTTDLKSYEVAERVGYHDNHYFCTVFKKATGRSPTEFRHEVAGAGSTTDG